MISSPAFNCAPVPSLVTIYVKPDSVVTADEFGVVIVFLGVVVFLIVVVLVGVVIFLTVVVFVRVVVFPTVGAVFLLSCLSRRTTLLFV